MPKPVEPDLQARLRGLAAHLAHFEAPDFEFGRWEESRTRDDGVIVLPWYSLSAEALAFVRDASKFGWVLMGFDWPTWIQTPEARVFVDDRAAIGRATPDELAKLLTVLIRQDRFVEGELAAAFESGVVTAILRRANELAGGPQ